MGLYKKLLVADDGSVSSSNALLQAFRLANEEKCWITVTTVVPSYEGDLDLMVIGNIHEALRRPGKEILARASEIARREGALIKPVLEEGEAFERIVDLADAENCGLIVMGRRGVSHLERALMGSTTARVIGQSNRDVLVVPKDTSIGWRRILLATDGSRFSEVATSKALEFAAAYGGLITAVSVVDVPPEIYAEAHSAVDKLIENAKGFVEAVKSKAQVRSVPVATYVGEGNAYEVIADLARREAADVIIMGSHGRTGLKRFLMGSVTEKVIGHAPCPVLVVKT